MRPQLTGRSTSRPIRSSSGDDQQASARYQSSTSLIGLKRRLMDTIVWYSHSTVSVFQIPFVDWWSHLIYPKALVCFAEAFEPGLLIG
ncbi:hypothetical protein BaRGS_00015339 [Batillaria attramentaria]|uniref:Uncharacterized protein n=1 Tax=Batillaria attramentaria TaxID=370345 RepID=A0ABD0L1Q8_9CAEN